MRARGSWWEGEGHGCTGDRPRPHQSLGDGPLHRGPSAHLPPQSAVLTQNGTGSLPRNLAATLQDIEAKRQLALQQKGEWPHGQPPAFLGAPGACCPAPSVPHAVHRTWFLNWTPGQEQEALGRMHEDELPG